MPSINLLPWRQALRQRRKKEFFIGTVASIALAALVALLAHLTVSSMIDSQHRRNDLLKAEIVELDKAIEQIVALEEQKDRMIARMEVIDTLQSSRPEVVKLFDQVVATLPEGVYLTSAKQSGRKIEFNGVAQSSTRVSAFMRNIDASETLSAPELKVIQTGKDSGPGSQFTLFANLRAGADADEEPTKPKSKALVSEISR
ncbi:MAG: type pilus assembly protein PilN [Steroidobacteraceae bacterium]|nr:type pilus assembly protein PilN [Steroidobacteraceae bacterium]MBM2854355.1 type pilus assembly protein PilN [Steroidobacteraceae bacterium]